MTLTHLFLDIKHSDPKVTLLYRFHITVILVNLIALIIDFMAERYSNAFIESCVVVILLLNLWGLRQYSQLKQSAYIFLATISTALLTLIFINHFATMSVVFILLLPLTTLLFIKLKHSILIELALFFIMAILLYIEYLNNPSNPLVQNPQALFNLAYTALIIFVFGLLYHFSIAKTFDELDSSNSQKEMLLSEVHHRVKNNLNVIASIIGLQANRLGEHEKQHLLASKTRIESIAMVHEMLYKCDDFENISFKAYMKQLTGLLHKMYASNKNIDITISSDRENMPLDVMIQLGMIANELFTNSIKYAFKQNSGNVIIDLQTKEDHYCFFYSDDGLGVEDTQTLLRSKSLGVKIIHLAAKQLQGTINISNQNGLSYEIEFKHE
ncbi:MAG: sensor histidine kinase [Campylobacterota bacterium]|nr:sensor histidine kinase [Campylobacterota bacterium]